MKHTTASIFQRVGASVGLGSSFGWIWMDWIKQTRTYATSITPTLDTPTTHRGNSMPRRRTKNGGARGASGAFMFDECMMIGRVADADEIVMMT